VGGCPASRVGDQASHCADHGYPARAGSHCSRCGETSNSSSGKGGLMRSSVPPDHAAILPVGVRAGELQGHLTRAAHSIDETLSSRLCAIEGAGIVALDRQAAGLVPVTAAQRRGRAIGARELPILTPTTCSGALRSAIVAGLPRVGGVRGEKPRISREAGDDGKAAVLGAWSTQAGAAHHWRRHAVAKTQIAGEALTAGRDAVDGTFIFARVGCRASAIRLAAARRRAERQQGHRDARPPHIRTVAPSLGGPS
jgi:hypothetical protein